MRFSPVVFAVLLASGCADSKLPTQPTVPPPAVVSTVEVVAIVVDSGGPCLDDGIVEIVRGQRAGERFPNALPCDYWGGPYIRLQNLTPLEPITLRGSAPGYEAQERTITPGLTRVVEFVLLPTK